jgi:hypothetical protein
MLALEELTFLHQICSTVLSTAKSVKYVGIMNRVGKLLVGDYRNEMQNSSVFPINGIQRKDGLFYLSYFLNAIETHDFDSGSSGSKLPPFKLLQFDTFSLAISPLTESNDKYLCMYLKSELQNDEIIKVLDVI